MVNILESHCFEVKELPIENLERSEKTDFMELMMTRKFYDANLIFMITCLCTINK